MNAAMHIPLVNLVTTLALVMMIASGCIIQRRLSARRRAKETIRRTNAALADRVETGTTDLRIRTEELAGSTEELARSAEELTRSNAALEQFAYLVAHDLQEPLRGVAGCVQILKTQYQGRLESRADELIVRMVDGVSRMRTLIDDLLAYSRAGRVGKPFEPGDCNGILGQALANLETVIAEAGAVVTHDQLPVANVDAAQLTQVFQNLVGNAIKFRGAQQPPAIHVAARQEQGRWVFSVKDNGIGIQPGYFDRIFVIFQRLHTRNEYAGTGIGLAICKKIVEHHGGRIFVASEPGRGSTFSFTIPEKE